MKNKICFITIFTIFIFKTAIANDLVKEFELLTNSCSKYNAAAFVNHLKKIDLVAFKQYRNESRSPKEVYSDDGANDELINIFASIYLPDNFITANLSKSCYEHYSSFKKHLTTDDNDESNLAFENWKECHFSLTRQKSKSITKLEHCLTSLKK